MFPFQPGKTVPSTSVMEIYHTHTSLTLFHRSATLTMILSSWFHSTGQKYAQLASSKKTIKIWTPENIDQLKGCFESTDWGVMIESSTSIDQATNVITSYIRFCEDNIVSKKSIKIFPNNKPWVTKRIKNTLNDKKIAFQSGRLVDRKIVQARLRNELKEGKRKYKTKIENLFK